MKKKISKFILRLMGWKIGTVIPDEPKCVICVAPHTSNWDFIIGKLFYDALGRQSNFLIKKEWFFFPFNIFFKSIGGVPVQRGRRTSVTDAMAKEFATRDRFQLAITPEGTRKAVKEWKRGFYYIATKANVPIALTYLDYGKKEAGIMKLFYPTGNEEQDIAAIRACYKGIKGKNADQFIE